MATPNATAPSAYEPLSPSILSRHNFLLQSFFTVLVVCVGTRILSEYRFRTIRHAKYTCQPPTVPYWIPFLRHAFSMAWDSQRFAAKCFRKYGDGTPFYIDAAGRKILVLLDPQHVNRVMNASTDLSPNPFIHEMVLGALLASPDETINFYKNDNGQMDHVQMAHIRQHVTGSSLISMSKKLFEQLTVNINEAYSEADASGWLTIPDLFDFVQYHVTRAITETLLGSTISQEHPSFYTDQGIFIDRSIEIVTGLPRWVIPAAYAARDRLLRDLKQWNSTSEALRMCGEADTQWDAVAGSGLLQERQERYAKTPGFDENARVSQILGLLFAGNGLTPTVSFWYLFEIMKDSSVFSRVVSEIQSHYDAASGSYDFMQLTVRPLLQSLHAEATRYYASNVTVRVLTSPAFALDDKYSISQGTTMFCYTKLTGLFTPGWKEARAQSIKKPLDTFWAERFLVAAGKERFSDAGLGGSWTSFGGGAHKCPGRHFARNIGIMTLAVLLGDYECEFVDLVTVQRAVPDIKDTAFGKMVPTEKIVARIRKRQR